MRGLKFELKKQAKYKAVWLLLLLFFLLDAISIYSQYDNQYVFAKLFRRKPAVLQEYKQLMERFGGEISTDKVHALLEIYWEYDAQSKKMLSHLEGENRSYFTGSFTMDYFLLKHGFFEPLQYLSSYQSYASTVANRAESNLRLIQHGGGAALAENQDIRRRFTGRSCSSFIPNDSMSFLFGHRLSSQMFLIVVLVYCTKLFNHDRGCEMDQLIYSSPAPQRIFWYKLSSLAVLLLVGLVLLSCFDFLLFKQVFPLTASPATPLFAVRSYGSTPLNISLGGYYLILCTVRLLALSVFAVLFLLCSVLCTTALWAALGSLLLVFLSFAVAQICSNYGLFVCQSINPYTLLTGEELFQKTTYLHLGSQALLQHQVALIAALVFLFCGLVSLRLLALRRRK